jgi:hypothetical protein
VARSPIVRFVEELVALGVATEPQCAAAIEAHRTAGGSFIEHLVLAGVHERTLLLPLCAALELVPAASAAVRQPEPKLANIFEYRLANRLLIVAYQLGDDRTLHVACGDPFMLGDLPEDLPPFTLRAACLSDIRAGLDAHLNIDQRSETSPDTLKAPIATSSQRSSLLVSQAPSSQATSAPVAAPDTFYGDEDGEGDTALRAQLLKAVQTELEHPRELSATTGEEDYLSDEPS